MKILRFASLTQDDTRSAAYSHSNNFYDTRNRLHLQEQNGVHKLGVYSLQIVHVPCCYFAIIREKETICTLGGQCYGCLCFDC